MIVVDHRNNSRAQLTAFRQRIHAQPAYQRALARGGSDALLS